MELISVHMCSTNKKLAHRAELTAWISLAHNHLYTPLLCLTVLTRPMSSACCASYMRAKNHISLAFFCPASDHGMHHQFMHASVYMHAHVQQVCAWANDACHLLACK